MAEPKLTADEILTGIASAVGAHDFKTVDGLLRLLGVSYPCRAEIVWTVMRAALDGRTRTVTLGA